MLTTSMSFEPLSEPRLSRRQKCPIFPTSSIFTWTKVMMLQWQIEEAKMSVSDTAVPVAATWSHPCTHARRN